MLFKKIFIWLISAALFFILSSTAWATFGKDDFELPKPVFTKQENEWIAELIPRGKILPVKIRFHVDGGVLAQPVAKVFSDSDKSDMDKSDIDKSDSEKPDIDMKNFWSGFFILDIIPAYGSNGEVTLAVSSDFFVSSTDIWGRTDASSGKWGNISTDKQSVASDKKNVNIINCVIRDGGAQDEDGMADGKIRLIIGPRDDFWNFALGAFIIRTFGVFLMLFVLMFGMTLSGKVFQFIDAKKRESQDSGKADSSSGSAVKTVKAPKAEKQAEAIAIEKLPSDLAAAIAMGIHLYTNGGRNLKLPAGGDTSQANMTAAAMGLALHLDNT